MTLKEFFFKKNLISSFSILLIVMLVALYFSNISLFKSEKIKMENKELIFNRVLEEKIHHYQNKAIYLRNNIEFRTYLKDGTLPLLYLKKEKRGKDYYYKYKKNALNKYKLISRIKKMFAIENEGEFFIEVIDKNSKILLSNSKIKIKEENLEKFFINKNFGEVSKVISHQNKLYLRVYKLDYDSDKLIIFSFELANNFLAELERQNLKILISNNQNNILISSFIEGKRIKVLKKLNKKENFMKKISGNYYQFKTMEIKNLIKNNLLNFVLIEKTKLISILIFRNFMIFFTLIFIGGNILLILNRSHRIFVEMIEEIKLILYSDKDVKNIYSSLDENQEIITKIEEYKEETKKRENIIEKEVEEKTRELMELNKKIEIQNNFLKRITGKEDVESILEVAFDEIKKVVDIEEIKFTAIIKGEEKFKIIKIDSKKNLTEEYKTVFKEEKLIIEDENKEIIHLRIGKKGVVSLLFKTSNIGGAMVTISYNTLKEEDLEAEELIMEIATLLKLALKSAKLYEISLKDPLTGVFNRTIMDFYLEKTFKKCKRYGGTFSLLMLDIDYFKKVNDNYGHLVGDYVLKKVVASINYEIREMDSLFRYGGEEFVLLLPDASKEEALLVAERVRKKIEETKINLSKFSFDNLDITVSIGVAMYNTRKHKNIYDLILLADENMYKAKNSGRNKVVL